MTSGKPMDRLVCGDVGFGKTEVALRAAFVALADGKQVALLVPTTLLAEQHFQTFSDRFADLPVRIAELSRFRTGQGSEGRARRPGRRAHRPRHRHAQAAAAATSSSRTWGSSSSTRSIASACGRRSS